MKKNQNKNEPIVRPMTGREKRALNRAAKKELEKVKIKLKGYLNAFYSICYFQEDKLDWNIITEQEYQKRKRHWKAWCKQRKYSEDIAAAFHWDCMLLKVDLIMQVKYQSEADNQELLELLKKGMTPLEVADYANKNLKTVKL